MKTKRGRKSEYGQRKAAVKPTQELEVVFLRKILQNENKQSEARAEIEHLKRRIETQEQLLQHYNRNWVKILAAHYSIFGRDLRDFPEDAVKMDVPKGILNL